MKEKHYEVIIGL